MLWKPFFIDSSALLAEIKGEPGAEAVREIRASSQIGDLYMHTVNACEVAYTLIKLGFTESAAYEMAGPRDITIIDVVRPKEWQRAASLKSRYQDLSLGDCLTIAHAEAFNVDILAGDRGFLQVETFIGVKLFR